jgi:pilus assembly protein CpaF
MKLSERMGLAGPLKKEPPARIGSTPTVKSHTVSDPLESLMQRAEEALFKTLGPALHSRQLDLDELTQAVNTQLDHIVANEEHLLSSQERREVVSALADNLLGMGPIQPLLDDPLVTEIMVNGPDLVFVERAGKLERAPVRFYGEDHIRSIIQRIVSGVDRRIDGSHPMVDARLPDGSRVNAVLPPLTLDSPTLTIRKFSDTRLSADDLTRNGTLSKQAAELLYCAVAGRASVIISGGTGTGKTTLLNVLSSFIPEDERIITIEDTAEIQLQQEHVVRMEARNANVQGVGEVTIRDLVVNALRMRPDRIIIGSVAAKRLSTC